MSELTSLLVAELTRHDAYLHYVSEDEQLIDGTIDIPGIAAATAAAGWVRNEPGRPKWEDVAALRHDLDAALNTPCIECGHS